MIVVRCSAPKDEKSSDGRIDYSGLFSGVDLRPLPIPTLSGLYLTVLPCGVHELQQRYMELYTSAKESGWLINRW